MATTATVYKVLPCTTAAGTNVPGHEIATYNYDPSDPIENVIFWTFSEQVSMPIEIAIHWTRASQYLKMMWPTGGKIIAVTLKSGHRCYARAMFVAHSFDGDYDTAPILCRDEFAIYDNSDRKLWEIVGVEGWIYSKRDAAATATYLPDPWERDNKIFLARQAELAAA